VVLQRSLAAQAMMGQDRRSAVLLWPAAVEAVRKILVDLVAQAARAVVAQTQPQAKVLEAQVIHQQPHHRKATRVATLSEMLDRIIGQVPEVAGPVLLVLVLLEQMVVPEVPALFQASQEQPLDMPVGVAVPLAGPVVVAMPLLPPVPRLTGVRMVRRRLMGAL
jgi:hypothetical protein